MLFDGTLQTWELVMSISLIPWLLAGPLSCIPRKEEITRTNISTAAVVLGMFGTIVGLIAIFVGAVIYMPHADLRDIISIIVSVALMVLAYFVAVFILAFLGVLLSAIIFPDSD